MFLDTSASRHIWSVHVVSIHGLPQFQPVAPFHRAIMFNVTITCNNLWVLWTVNLLANTVYLILWDSHMWQISQIFKVSLCWQFEQWAEWLSTSSRPPLMKLTWPLLEVWLSSWSTCSSWRSSIEGTKKNRTECFKMTAYVRTINGKTISMKCNRPKKQQRYWRQLKERLRSHEGWCISWPKKKAIWQEKVENNIKARTTIEMPFRMISGLEKEELMQTTETEEDPKKKKWMKMCESNPTRPSLRCDVLEKRNNQRHPQIGWKMESYSKKTDEKMVNCLLAVTNSVGTQIRGMNSTIENLKEESDDTRTNISTTKSRTWKRNSSCKFFFEKVRSKLMDPAQNHGKTVATNFHGDISEKEVEHLLRRR